MQTLENGTVIGSLYNNIGSIQFWLKDFVSAINYYQRSIDFFISIGDTKELAVQYSNVGEAYTELAEFEKALEYFEIAQEETLLPIKNKIESQKYRAFIAVFAEKIRLIDNISL